MDRSNPSHFPPPGPIYDDEPPAYPFSETSSFESPVSPNRHHGPTMRLLPTTEDIDDDLISDVGSSAAHYPSGQPPPPPMRPYVSPPGAAQPPVSSISVPVAKDAPASPPMEPSSAPNPALSSKSTLSGPFPVLPPAAAGKKPSIVIVEPEKELDLKVNPGISKSQNTRSADGTFPTPPKLRIPSLTVPLPLFHPSARDRASVGRNFITGSANAPIEAPSSIATTSPKRRPLPQGAFSEEPHANKVPCSVSQMRPPTQPPYQFHQRRGSDISFPSTRPDSSISNPPSFPPPPSVTDDSEFSSRPGSPSRPWSPSSHGDWARPPPAPSVSSVSYEPADVNGNPRPGSPSARYGGSPRRPLPPAPLFSGPAAGPGGSEVSIDIDDTYPNDDVFGPGGRTFDPRNDARASVRSYDSESTVVMDEREEELRKVTPYDNDRSEKMADPKLYYGPAPEGKQVRRGVRPAQMAKKEVRLINGELVLECKIPTILHSFLPRRDAREFTHMRYTAVTCDPDDFVDRGYKLRQQIGSTMRETELFICVTMYNENEVDFTRTMHGIMRNISHFCSRTKSRTWGKDGWQKIVVCIIADGRQKVHPRTLNALAAMGIYQEGIAKNIVNQKEVTAHVYEYTTQVSLDSDLKFKGAEKGIVPCQVIFCLKERNQKKLNSHRWFFNAFGRALQPNVCILLDVGTKPAPTALYHLWKAFDQDSNVAGAAGEIKAGKGKGWLGLLNPLVASQNFEYKMSNILDKPLESVFGYITVLPGALSAYRYYALQNDATGHGPLSQYFKGETLHGKDADVFTANMYLAEDRILCWELVAKREERWVLKFVKSAVGETDVPDSVPEFISQRRRWLNGAFFAAVYSIVNWRQIWKTDHTLARKILLHIEFVYQFVSLLFTYFGLANFYLAFYFIAGSLADPEIDPFGHNMGKYIFNVLRYACVLVISLQFILSMGNRPQGAKKMFLSGMIVYGIIMFYMTFAAMYMVITNLLHRNDPHAEFKLGNNMFTNVVVSMLSTIGLYFFMSFLYLDPWHMFTSSAQYFALLPSYICTLQIYAFCNTHDVTWGTKGDNTLHTDLGAARAVDASTVEVEMPSEQLDIDSGYDEALRNLRDRVEVPKPPVSESQMQEDYYRAVRTYMVSIWMIANMILAMGVSEAYGYQHSGNNVYLGIILWSVAALAVFRAIGSATFAILNVIHKIAEGKMKFSAGNINAGFNGPAGSALGTHYGGRMSLRDWVTETWWTVKRKLVKVMFWRR